MIIGACNHIFVGSSVFLANIKEAFDKDPHLKNLLLDDFFKNAIEKCQVYSYVCLTSKHLRIIKSIHQKMYSFVDNRFQDICFVFRSLGGRLYPLQLH